MTETLHPSANFNINRDPNQILYDVAEIKWGQMSHYVVHSKLGRGKYSHVFDGSDKRNNKKVAIKVLVPIRKQKIRREYHILKSLNHPNIAKIYDIVQCSYLKTTSFILENCPHVDFRDLYPTLSRADIRIYMKQLLQGLHYIHSNGIMHRDIKPFNVLINPSTKALKIIDFGLSDYYFPSKQSNEHVGSIYYKAPELLFGNPSYDYRVDIWSAGVIFAGMKTPFIQGNDNIDQLLKITKLLGTNEVVSYIKQYKLAQRKGHTKQNICFDILVAHQNGEMAVEGPSTFDSFQNENNKENCTKQAIDLIKKMLELNYNKRITAEKALEHPFFKQV